jgi:thiamine kinase-like enzyme
MTEVEGRSNHRGADRAFVIWLAKLHATYWGARSDDACDPIGRHGGLQTQGCYWHLDTRPEEHQRMSNGGWMGRLKLSAKAIDRRLKQDPMQSVCHGDAKGANIVYATGEAGEAVPVVYDFQYCGKAAVTKDLAYFFNVEAGHDNEASLLTHYHAALSQLLRTQGDTSPSFEALETSLELALCDWRRFSEVGLGGWGD